MPIRKQFTTAICGFQKYPLLLQQKGISVFLYYILFTIIYSIIMITPFYVVYHQSGGLVSIIDKSLPNFSISDGILTCEELIGRDKSGNIFYYVNTSSDTQLTAEKGDEMGEKYSCAMLFDSDSMIFINAVQPSNKVINEFTYKELGLYSLSKDSLLKYFSSRGNRLFYILPVCIVFFVSVLFMLTIFLIWLICLTTLINNVFIKAQLRFTHIIKLCIYSLTFPSLFQAVFTAMGLTLPSLIYMGLVCAYIYIGLKNCKNTVFPSPGSKLPDEGIVIAEL